MPAEGAHMTSVAVIGLGAMGGAVARRLREFDLPTTVHDTAPAAVERAVRAGCTRAGSAAEAAADADVLITSLPADDPLLEVMSDPGVRAGLGDGFLVELSTVRPETIITIRDRMAGAGTRVIDAPVSGGPGQAATGELVLFAGAEPEDLSAVRPLLELLGRVEYVGGVGLGKAMKLVNNVMSIGNLAVGAEAFGLGRRLGLDERLMLDVVSRSGGRSHAFLKHMSAAVEGDFTPGFTLDLSAKDMRLALDNAAEHAFTMPVADGVGAALERGIGLGFGAENYSSLLKVFRPAASPSPEEE